MLSVGVMSGWAGGRVSRERVVGCVCGSKSDLTAQCLDE